MRIHISEKLAAQMGVRPGDDRVQLSADGGMYLDVTERGSTRAPASRPAYMPTAPQGPGKTALALAAFFVASKEAADQAEGLALAASRFDQV